MGTGTGNVPLTQSIVNRWLDTTLATPLRPESFFHTSFIPTMCIGFGTMSVLLHNQTALSAAYFDIRVCHPHADSYKDLTLKQLYKQQENEKKHKYASRILEVEQGTFTPLVISTTGGMGEECARYHARLVDLLATKKGETYSTTVSWIWAKVLFALLRG